MVSYARARELGEVLCRTRVRSLAVDRVEWSGVESSGTPLWLAGPGEVLPVCSPPWQPFACGWPPLWLAAGWTSCTGGPSLLCEWTQTRTMTWRVVLQGLPRTPLVPRHTQQPCQTSGQAQHHRQTLAVRVLCTHPQGGPLNATCHAWCRHAVSALSDCERVDVHVRVGVALS